MLVRWLGLSYRPLPNELTTPSVHGDGRLASKQACLRALRAWVIFQSPPRLKQVYSAKFRWPTLLQKTYITYNLCMPVTFTLIFPIMFNTLRREEDSVEFKCNTVYFIPWNCFHTWIYIKNILITWSFKIQPYLCFIWVFIYYLSVFTQGHYHRPFWVTHYTWDNMYL